MHCALYQLHNLSGNDSLAHSHADGTEANVSSPSASAHGSDSHASRGLKARRNAVMTNG